MVGLTSARGPNWIHGTSDNPILHLAKKTETDICLIKDGTQVFDQFGHLINRDKATRFFDLMWDIISDAFKFSNENCSKISPEASLKDFFMQKISKSELSDEDRTLILQIAEMWGGFIGDPWDKQSLRYFWLEECLDGGEFFSLWLNSRSH